MYFPKSVLMKVSKMPGGLAVSPGTMRPQSQNQDLSLPRGHLRGLLLSNPVTENHSDKVLPEHMGEDVTLQQLSAGPTARWAGLR